MDTIERIIKLLSKHFADDSEPAFTWHELNNFMKPSNGEGSTKGGKVINVR